MRVLRVYWSLLLGLAFLVATGGCVAHLVTGDDDDPPGDDDDASDDDASDDDASDDDASDDDAADDDAADDDTADDDASDDDTEPVNDCPEVAVLFDFESGDQGFTHAETNPGLNDRWDRGNPDDESCYSGNLCWATRLEGNYRNCDAGQLLSPILDLSDCAGAPNTVELRFWHLYRFEESWQGYWFDGGVLQVSSNGGNTWQIVNPTPGYDGQLDGDYMDCDAVAEANGMMAWSGTIPGDQWTQVTLPLDAGLLTSDFRFRLIFASDETEREEGWYVDNAEIAVY